MTATEYPHVELRTDGLAYLKGTPTKVLEVVLDRLAHHWDADEIRRQHPHLTLGQIYSALAYYHDHQTEVDRAIQERAKQAEEVKVRLGESPLRAKLKALGLVP